jgi:DNA-binding IclR family transcriptional regulator
MKGSNPPVDATPRPDAIAIHLLARLTRLTKAGRRTHLEELAREVGVRKSDARTILSALDRQGYVDVLRMRPTLMGLTIGEAADAEALSDLRRAPAVAVRAA